MIKILDNFFDLDTFIKIKNFTRNGLTYTPRYFEESEEKIDKNTYGLRFRILSNESMAKIFLSEIEKKFHLKIVSIGSDSGIDKRKLTMFKPHTDELSGKLNFFLMIDGPTAVTNGICFYNKEKNLDMHIGFMENRAVLFPSNIFHSPSVSEDKKTWRTTATIFIKDYCDKNKTD